MASDIVYGPTRPVAPHRSRFTGAPLYASREGSTDWVAVEVPRGRVRPQAPPLPKGGNRGKQ
jgi:hypothetical protein